MDRGGELEERASDRQAAEKCSESRRRRLNRIAKQNGETTLPHDLKNESADTTGEKEEGENGDGVRRSGAR